MAQSLLNRFLSGMLATGVGSLSVVVLGMVGLMLTARLLPAEALGAFFLLQLLTVFAAESTSGGIHMGLERFLSGTDDIEQQRRMISTAFLFRAATALLAAVLLLPLMGPLFDLLGVAPSPALVGICIVWFLLEAVMRLLLAHHQARFAFRAIGATNVVSSVLNLAVILVLVVGLGQGFTGLLVAKLVSRLAAVGYAWATCPPRLGATMDGPLLRMLLRYSLPLYANYFLAFTAVRADTLLIGWLLGTGAVAYYEVARRIPDSLVQFYDAFRQVYFPFVARDAIAGKKPRVAELVSQATRFGALILGTGCVIAFAFGEQIIVLLFSETYLPSVLPFGLLMLAVSLLMLESMLGATLAALGDSTRPLLINTGRTLLLLAAYLLLIPRFGVAGAALAAVLAAATVIPVNLYFLRRHGLAIRTRGLIASMTTAGALALVLAVWAPESLLLRGAITAAFLPLILALSVITVPELAAGARSLGRLLKRLRDRGPRSAQPAVALVEPHANTARSSRVLADAPPIEELEAVPRAGSAPR